MTNTRRPNPNRALLLLLAAIALPASALAQGDRACFDGVAAQVCDLPDHIGGIEVAGREKVDEGCLYNIRIPDSVYPTRSFLLLVPARFEAGPAAAPLLVDFHGAGSSKRGQYRASCWKGKACDVGALVAYPSGTGVPRQFAAGDYCCYAKVGPPTDDVDYTYRVVDAVRTLFPENDLRAYATGLSNGGAMAHELACEATDLFSGIAAYSQTFTKRDVSACLSPDETPMPVFSVRTTEDLLIPYGGGFSAATAFTGNWLSAEESRERWAEALQCSGSPVKTYVTAKGENYCLSYSGCSADFTQCTLEAPHAPYRAAGKLGFNLCDAAWEFWGETAPAPGE